MRVAFCLLVLFSVLVSQEKAHAVPADTTATCQALMEREDALSEPFYSIWYDPSENELRRTQTRREVLGSAQQVCAPAFPNETAYAYSRQAYVEAQLRNFDAMRATFETFFRRYGSVPTDTSSISRDAFATVYHYRAFLYGRIGNRAVAADSYIQALDALPEEDVSTAITLLRNLALTYRRMHDDNAARAVYKEIEERVNELDSDTETYRAVRSRFLFTRAGFLVESDLYNQTPWSQIERDLQESLSLSPQPATAYQANRLGLLAEAHAGQGEIDDALRLNNEALREARAADAPREVSFLQMKHGSFLMMAGRLADAEPYLRQAMTDQPASQHEDQRRILSRLGFLYELQGDWQEAETQYRRAIEHIEAQRSTLRTTDWALSAFGEWQAPYRALMRVQMEQGHANEALQTLERTRARHLMDVQMEAEIVHALSDEQRVRYDSLTQALQSVRTQRAEQRATLSNMHLWFKETNLITERQSLLNLPERSSPSLRTIQDTLAAQDRVAVSYYIDSPDARFDRPARSFAFVVTPDTIHTVSLDTDAADIEARLTAVSPLFASEGDASAIGAAQFDLRPLKELYDMLIAPLDAHLPADHALTAVPDGPMFRLPLAMLAKDISAGRYNYAQAHFLVHDRPTSTQLSLRTLADEQRVSPTRRLDIAAFGRSTFDSVRVNAPLATRSMNPPSAQPTPSSIPLPDLPGVEREIDRIGTLFKESRVFREHEATASTLRSFSTQASIIHLSSHALVNPRAPLQNAFVLAPENENGSGLLYLHELQGEFADIPLVNLSGCDTAQGTVQRGEGMRSLQYAFRAVGAQATLSTLWPIDDDAAVALNDVFYQHLQDGLPKDKALQRAQMAYQRAHPDQSPFFWAGIVLHGSPHPITLRAPSPRIPYYYYVLVFVGCAGLAFIWWSYRNWK